MSQIAQRGDLNLALISTQDQDHRRCLFCHLAGIRLKILIRDDDAQLTAGIGWPGCLRETSVGSQYCPAGDANFFLGSSTPNPTTQFPSSMARFSGKWGENMERTWELGNLKNRNCMGKARNTSRKNNNGTLPNTSSTEVGTERPSQRWGRSTHGMAANANLELNE